MVPNDYFLLIASFFAILPLSLSVPQGGSILNSKRYLSIDAKSPNDPRIWSNKKLKYVWASDKDKDALQQTLQDAWKLWTPDTGPTVKKDYIDIEEETDDAMKRNALKITATDEDKAITTVGYITGKQPTLLFGNNQNYGLLDKTSNMAHELGHALGLYHEHERFDRDQHVEFNCKNLKDYTAAKARDGFCDNTPEARQKAGLLGWSSYDFIIRPQREPGSLNGPPGNCASTFYDTDSLMHYPGKAGGRKILDYTMTVLKDKNTGKPFQKNTKPSALDIYRINIMYKPEDKPAVEKRGDNDIITSYCGVSATYSSLPTTTPTVTSLMTTTTAQTTTAPVVSSTTVPSSTSVAASTPAPVAPYAQGVCHIHVTQWDLDGKGNYDLEVLMTDNDNNQIGYTERGGGPYSDSNPLGFQSKLEDLLWCKPESQNDYIAFAAGVQAWPSDGDGDYAAGDVPSCSVGGWDLSPPFDYWKREMDCAMACGWSGGKPSDGTGGAV